METSLWFDESGIAVISSDQRKYINLIRRLKEQHPDQVEIRDEPETNDGCIVARIPASWFRIQVPKQYTDEERAALRERFVRNVQNALSYSE